MITFFIYENTSYCQINIEDVLKSRYRDSPYVVFKLKYKGKSKDFFMQNDELFFNYSHKLGLTHENYAVEIMEKIQTNTAIEVSREVWLALQDYAIKYDKRVDDVSLKGKEHFVEFFFWKRGSVRIMKSNVCCSYSCSFIIKKLFDWGIYVERDDLSGFLRIIERKWPVLERQK